MDRNPTAVCVLYASASSHPHAMDEQALGDPPAMDAAAVAEAEAAAAALTGEHSSVELAEYADMAGLAEGQRVMLQLPAGERAGTESVIMEVVRVDGNQIHFIAPDPGPHGDSASGHGEVKDEPTTLLELPEGTEFEDHSTEEVEFEDPGEETGEFEDPSTENAEYEDSNAEEMEEVPAEEIPRCFLCFRPASGIPLHSLVLERTSASSCSLAERICACAAPMRLDVSTADGVCEHCLQLVNAADEHLQQYEVMSSKIAELVRSADQRRSGAVANPASTADAAAAAGESEAEGGQEGTDGDVEGELIKEEEGVEVGESDSDDSDWAPAGPTPRSTRSRVPKVRRRWSPEPIERPPHDGAPRGRGRPRKHPPPAPPPTVIEYSDLDTLKEQVKDIKTTKFNIKPAQPKRPLKAVQSDLEKIIHLEVRAADGSPLGAVAGAGPRGRGRPSAMSRAPTSAYECRRCDIQFQDSSEMVKHLRQHVSKPWCKRCRTEFPHRQAMLEHRRACRLRHRSGDCSICGRRVAFYRYHMRQHTDLVAQGLLEEGQAIPEEDDRPPPSAQKRVGKFLAGGVCSICGEHVPERLRKHERAHNITHTCPICKKVFTREDVVRGHIKRVHMKERPHVCAQCGKTFVSVYSLQRHEMIHKNEYRFYCQECGDGFRQKQQLTAHMRHKHGVVDVVFEDVQVMPEGAAVVDALSVITEPHEAVYEGAVLEADFDKEEYVITAAGDGDDVQFTAVADADGHLRLEA